MLSYRLYLHINDENLEAVLIIKLLPQFTSISNYILQYTCTPYYQIQITG